MGRRSTFIQPQKQVADLKEFKGPWNPDNVQYLIDWWPHWGTVIIANKLNLSRQQVKSKVNSMNLLLLPRDQRLCSLCQLRYQDPKNRMVLCRDCRLQRRAASRRSQERTREQWMGETLAVRKYSSDKQASLTVDFLIDLWDKQNGLCYYSGLPMIEPKYGAGRNAFTASLDRLDSSLGYIPSNVVWAMWICNVGKNNFTVDQYLSLCKAVAEHWGLQNTPQTDSALRTT